MTLRPEPYEAYRSDRVFDALETLEREAGERGVSMAGLSLAWLLALPEITAVVVGPNHAEHLAPAAEALEVDLSPIDRDRLTEVFS
jgi:aryl-alcohol dehydrogenase-like predicted oxidoreductase